MTDLSQMSDAELMSLYQRSDASAAMPALIAQESGGKAGVLGPPTRYGRAQGLTQMLPATAQATAQKLGMPWRPELMTASTPEAADYQRALGQGYLQEGIDKTGSVEDGLRYYHGGPDRKQWGPKTEAYAQQVSSRMQQPRGLSDMSDAELMAIYNQGAPQAAGYTSWKNAAGQTEVGPASSAPKPAAAQPKSDHWAGATAQLLRALPLADELAGVSRGVVDIATGKAKINPAALASAAMQALPGNRPTEAWAALQASGVPAAFAGGLKAQRGVEDAYQAEHPHLAAAARAVGGAASVALPAGPVATTFANGSRAVNALRGATTAGLTAAGYAALDRGTPQERLRAASSAARDPIVLALGAGAGALAPAAAGRQRPQPVDVEKLRAAKQAAYEAVDQAGVKYTPQAFGDLADNIAKDAASAKLNPMRHPKAASMLEEIQGLKGSSPSLTELDQLRQVVRRDVASASDDAERFFGQRMIKQIDDFIDTAGPNAVVAGDAQQAAGLMKNARASNTRFRKVEDVTDAVESAKLRAGSTGSGGNVDNAIRQNLRRVLENGKNFSPEEEAALKSIVMGGKGQNALRLVGKLSPSGNGLMAALNLGSAATFGGMGAVPGAAGIGAKAAADAMTRQKVTSLLALMANERVPPSQAAAARQQLTQILASNPALTSARSQAAGRLVRGVGAVGGTGR